MSIKCFIGQKEVVKEGKCPIKVSYWTKGVGEKGKMSNKGDLLDKKRRIERENVQ